jgi:hypothetical protein
VRVLAINVWNTKGDPRRIGLLNNEIRCRLPAAWDHREGFSATRMGPPGCQ